MAQSLWWVCQRLGLGLGLAVALRPITWLDFNFKSNLFAKRWFMVCAFLIHLLWMFAGKISSQLQPEVHYSCRSILNLTATVNTRPKGSHNWPTRPKQRLLVSTSNSPRSFFLKVNVSDCFCQHNREDLWTVHCWIGRFLCDWNTKFWSGS